MKRRSLGLWLAVGWIGFAALPWNAIGGQGFLAFRCLAAYPLGLREAPAAVQLALHGRLWLLPLVIARALPTLVFARRIAERRAARLLLVAGCIGSAWILSIALSIDINGWTGRPLAALFGDLPGRQPGLGYGGCRLREISMPFSPNTY